MTGVAADIDSELVVLVMDFLTVVEYVDGTRLRAIKKAGPRSTKFMEWKYKTEDAIARLLGPDSTTLKRLKSLSWPDSVGDEFSTVVDEARIILECSIPEIVRSIPTLRDVAFPAPTGRYPDELERIIREIRVCLRVGACSAAAVLTRKAVEAAIFLKFEKEKNTEAILTKAGDSRSFVEKVALAVKHNYLSPQKGADLRKIKWWGDSGAHSYRVVVSKAEVMHNLSLLDICLQEMFG